MEENVHMGKFAVAKDGHKLRTTLGSCVGVVLFDKDKRIYGLAHVMLPASPHANPEAVGKYMDTAIPALVKAMGYTLEDSRSLKAKISGGADMFSAIKKTSSIAIGDKNIEAAQTLLAKYRIALLGKDVGGIKGRQMIIDSATGKISVTQIGEQAIEL